jgi:ABC-type methionine transport system permease subunit
MSYRARENSAGCAALAAHAKTLLAVMVVAAVALLAMGVVGASRGTGAESWQVLLAHQLKEQQRCTLAEVLFVREVKVGGRVGMEGRIRCTDTREYDFTREHENQRFTLRKCEQVSVC